VSSLVAYDIYREYINPQATGAQILMVSRVAIVVFGGLMGVLSVALEEMGLSLGWVYLFMGIVIGSAVPPIWFCLMWDKASGTGAVVAAVTGQVCAVVTWLIAASLDDADEISIDTLGKNESMLAGNLMAIGVSAFTHIIWSTIWPEPYDWKSMGEIKQVEDDDSGITADDLDQELLTRASDWIKKWGYSFTLLIVIIWPLASLPAGEFSRGYFGFWVAVSVTWAIVATLVIILLPIYETWDNIIAVINGIFGNPQSLTQHQLEFMIQENSAHLDGVIGALKKKGYSAEEMDGFLSTDPANLDPEVLISPRRRLNQNWDKEPQAQVDVQAEMATTQKEPQAQKDVQAEMATTQVQGQTPNPLNDEPQTPNPPNQL